MKRESRFQRAHVGRLNFTLAQRLMLLFTGRLWFVARKQGGSFEIAWSVMHPRNLK